ncbi:hypothetical protein Avbf_14084 [Armadillidium vulgare]|nr:hypothetical protein Avbf_14084 [Armadillidium vulgare]
MKLLLLCVIVVLSMFLLPFGNGKKILLLTPMGSKSHKIFYMAISEVLAKRGHQVTLVSGVKPTKKVDNIREIVAHNYSIDPILVKIFEDSQLISALLRETPDLCFRVLEQPHIQALKKEKFDIIIITMFFNYCFLSFVHHFKVPFIYAWTTTIYGIFHGMIGNIDVPAISGFMYSETSFPFTFKQRLETAILNEIFKHSNELYLEPK